MAQLINGKGGRGIAMVYDAPQDMILRIQTISFVVDTGAEAGLHYPAVGLGDSSQPIVSLAVSPNGADPSSSVSYNFGVGYVSAAILTAAPKLLEATAALPEIDLFPGGHIQITMNQVSGTLAPNDVISQVFVYADLIPDTSGPQFGIPPLVPGLLYG